MITRWFFVFSATLTFTTAHATPRPRVRPSAALIASLACEDELTRIVGAVENSLESLDARRASVYLGQFTELPELLVRAGLTPERAAVMNEAISKVRWLAFNTPNLRYPAQILTDFLGKNVILTCVASKNCVIPGPDANHLMYTGVGAQAVVLMPTPKVEAGRFAVNFWGTVSAVAGEQFLLQWVQAGFNRELENRGSADLVWRTFVSRGYKGGLPRPGQALDQGFALTFLLLYQAYQSGVMYDLFGVDDAERNYRHMSDQIIEQLHRGAAGHLTSAYVGRLSLTRDDVFDRVGELIFAMNETIAADQASGDAN